MRNSLARLARRLLAIADEPGESDDTRLRKHAGVLAGYITIVAPLGVPAQVPAFFVGLAVGGSLAVFSAVNLFVLARTKRFDRYVTALLSAGIVFVPAATVIGGGVTGASNGLAWAFLAPAYAIFALGPRRARRWFAAFLASVVVIALIDPFALQMFAPGPYEMRVVGAVVGVVAPVTIVFLMLVYTDLRRRAAEARSDELLTNAIPASVALRLKHGEQRIAERYGETTVLFADIAGFTPWSAGTEPERVVEVLDDLFTAFDAISERCGMEKIKTIGDAYMAVAGAPEPVANHARAAYRMAQAMLGQAETWRQKHDVDLQLRIGLASGPIVGGVIGDRRILFDVWGDTVNRAARMEEFGVAGHVQVSAETRRLLPDTPFDSRNIEIKGLGRITTFLSTATDTLSE